MQLGFRRLLAVVAAVLRARRYLAAARRMGAVTPITLDVSHWGAPSAQIICQFDGTQVRRRVLTQEDALPPRVGFNWNPKTSGGAMLGWLTGGDKFVVRRIERRRALHVEQIYPVHLLSHRRTQIRGQATETHRRTQIRGQATEKHRRTQIRGHRKTQRNTDSGPQKNTDSGHKKHRGTQIRATKDTEEHRHSHRNTQTGHRRRGTDGMAGRA
jgi:hypothetical protein